jgi:chromosome segregation ATPase
MAITREDVFTAADKIAETGEAPKLETVRQKLGGGSWGTIGPHLKEWKEAHKQAPTIEPSAAELTPQAIIDMLLEIGPKVWGIAAGIANSHLTAERASMDQERAELRKELTDSNATGDAIETDLQAAKIEIKKITDETQATIQEITDKAQVAAAAAAAELATQTTRAITAEGKVADLSIQADKQMSIIEQLRGEVSTQTSRAGIAEARATDLATQADKQASIIEQLRGDLKTQTSRADKAEAQAGELAKQGSEQQGIIDQLRENLESQTTRATEAETITRMLNEAHKEQAATIEKLRTDMETQTSARIQAEADIKHLTYENEKQKETIKKWNEYKTGSDEEIKALNGEITRLKAEVLEASKKELAQHNKR